MAQAATPRPQDIVNVRATINSYLTSGRVGSNWLVGRGIILYPGFECAVTLDNGTYNVVISGDKGTFSTKCSRVIVSKYRPEITFILDQSVGKPILTKLTPLQGARQKMLGVVKPNASITSERFYALTATGSGGTQVNARRRWGELRTEYGFDTTFTGGAFARGQETPIAEPNPRPEMGALNSDHWDAVYKSCGGVCNKCGTPIAVSTDDDGVPGLLDHRRPVPVGGGDDRTNLQLFCTVCNNTKATICRNCPFSYNCESCTWAYPESFHDMIMIRVEPDVAVALVKQAEKEKRDVREISRELFQKAVRGH